MVNSVSEHTPALFERVPRGLFGPLGDLYAELYWELLAELYRHEFEREPFVVVRPTALDTAEAVIRGSRLWSERRQDLEALASQDASPLLEHQRIRGPMVRSGPPGRPSVSMVDSEGFDETAAIRALARRLVARLEDSGWMHFQYRAGVGEIMSFHAYAARILQTLLDVARDEQPVLQGLVHSIAALLEPTAFAQRPGVSLSEARRHTLELSRELKILERNIHLFIQRVLDDAATAADVLEEELHIGKKTYALEDFAPAAHLPDAWADAWVDALVSSGVQCVTTIENEYPFLSYIEQADGPAGLAARGEVAVYTAGFPTPRLVTALTQLARKSKAEFQHWGDADVGGLRIWCFLRSRLACPLALVRTTAEWVGAESSSGGRPLSSIERHALARIRRELADAEGADVDSVRALIDALLDHGVKLEQERY
jgi:hypothetical protein